MNFTQYQNLSQTTAGHLNGGDGKLNLIISAAGISGEAGEVLEIVKKYVGHGHLLDIDKITKELGDVLWYVADVSAQLGIDLNDIAELNIKKLKARYPDGFSHNNSINRDE